ncbi:MAG TPA: hypothetical protein VME47_15520, partial [Acetobacteraceae bacterium]|nr:hypothetical protein [Acetobacteraceae bacterium]
IERRNATAYDRATDLLLDLKALSQEKGAVPDFLGPLAAIRTWHSAKGRFIERLNVLDQAVGAMVSLPVIRCLAGRWLNPLPPRVHAASATERGCRIGRWAELCAATPSHASPLWTQRTRVNSAFIITLSLPLSTEASSTRKHATRKPLYRQASISTSASGGTSVSSYFSNSSPSA